MYKFKNQYIMLQDLEKITFEQLPHAVAMLIKEVRELKVLVEKGYKLLKYMRKQCNI